MNTMRSLRYFFLFTDIGFILYWTVTLFGLLPAQYLYNDYTDPFMVNWNWSFFPLDMLVSGTGLYSIRLAARGSAQWRPWALVSLVLTTASGLQAIAYWSVAGDFNPTWWLPNVFLMIYPLLFIRRIMTDWEKR